jgi:hypothetical protein
MFPISGGQYPLQPSVVASLSGNAALTKSTTNLILHQLGLDKVHSGPVRDLIYKICCLNHPQISLPGADTEALFNVVKPSAHRAKRRLLLRSLCLAALETMVLIINDYRVSFPADMRVIGYISLPRAFIAHE